MQVACERNIADRQEARYQHTAHMPKRLGQLWSL